MSMTASLPESRQSRNGGFTLIEVLVTVVVMALGLLGIAALQAVALKSSRTALYHSYATFYASDIADCMRANRPAADAGSYNREFAESATAGTIAGDDMVAWKAAIAANLPGGQGRVSVQGGSAAIEVRWNEATPSDANRTLTFSTQTSL